MKRIIRLTESDLARIVRRVIKESNEADMVSCIADAYGLNLADMIKLAPCAECQKNPSPENGQKCLNAAEKVIKSKGYSILELGAMTMKAAGCVTGISGNKKVSFPGYGGGQF